jgi:hypothetical protein
MEAHTEVLRIPAGNAAKANRGRLNVLRERIQARRRDLATRVQAAQANRSLPNSIRGSEHTHLLPPKAY